MGRYALAIDEDRKVQPVRLVQSILDQQIQHSSGDAIPPAEFHSRNEPVFELRVALFHVLRHLNVGHPAPQREVEEADSNKHYSASGQKAHGPQRPRLEAEQVRSPHAENEQRDARGQKERNPFYQDLRAPSAAHHPDPFPQGFI